MSIKVSVIIPVYNTEKYLRQCLDSVTAQTLSDIEIICVNDGSPDNSIDILREYEKKDSRLSIIDKQNEGVGRARNDGIGKASGEFVAFMDSDDYYPGDTVLETLYDNAVNNDVSVSGGVILMQNTDEALSAMQRDCFGLSFSPPKGVILYKDYQYDYGYTGFIYKKSVLSDNDVYFPSYSRFQDPPFFVRAMIAAEKMYIAEIPSYIYRMTPSSDKIRFQKALDMLLGMRSNLELSKESSLAKLHYLTYMRLNKEGSYAIIQNLLCENANVLLAQAAAALSSVDAKWLIAQGYDITNPPRLDVFDHLIDVNRKYDNIRNNPIVRIVRKVRKR